MNSKIYQVLFIVLVLTFGISAFFRLWACVEGGMIQRQEEVWLALVLRLDLAVPLLIVIFLNIFWPISLAWVKFDPPAWLRYVGLALAILCVPLLWWIFTSIGKNISETVLIKDGHELVTHGPYIWVRHPLYGGALVLLLSISLVFGDYITLGLYPGGHPCFPAAGDLS